MRSTSEKEENQRSTKRRHLYHFLNVRDGNPTVAAPKVATYTFVKRTARVPRFDRCLSNTGSVVGRKSYTPYHYLTLGPVGSN